MLFQKKEKISLPEIIDIHSHVLPGIDDGSRHHDMTMHMLEIAVSEGITTIVATPHHMPGKGYTPPDKIREMVTQLQIEADNADMGIRILPGNELFYREDLLDLLEEGQIMGMNGTDFVLVEFDVMAERPYIRNAMRNILALGYVPILAHVERYPAILGKDYETIRILRKLGVLIQANAASITGEVGKDTQKHMKKLLKEGLIDLVGTDAHTDRNRAPRMQECIKVLEKWCEPEYVQALVWKNAAELLGSEKSI